MPLIKRMSSQAIVEPPVAQPDAVLATKTAAESNAPISALIKLRTATKTQPVSTKENYWERKEERDIETGKRIRRSGVWQAALQSLAPLQFNSAGTLESYLELVAKVAEEGLKFVQKD